MATEINTFILKGEMEYQEWLKSNKELICIKLLWARQSFK